MQLSLQTIYNFYVDHPESGWIMKTNNVFQFYKFLKDHNFKKILDLGTGIGCTAAIMSLVFKEKGVEDYEIHTIEQFKKCYDIAQEIMPEELKKNVKFYFSPPVVWNTELIPYVNFTTFKELPEGDWDLILVDGPGGWMENDKYVDIMSGDVFKMLLENKIKPGTYIAWDGRIKPFQALEKYFGNNFYYVPISQSDDFNIIERKEGEVDFVNEELESMKRYGYFKGIESPTNLG